MRPLELQLQRLIQTREKYVELFKAMKSLETKLLGEVPTRPEETEKDPRVYNGLVGEIEMQLHYLNNIAGNFDRIIIRLEDLEPTPVPSTLGAVGGYRI